MSDDAFTKQLSKFTPDSSGLDRDALLFAAGRASARANRRWMALAGALAASQLVTLGVLLWPGQVSPIQSPEMNAPTMVIVEPRRPSGPEVPAPQAQGVWNLSQRDFATEGDPPVATAADELMPPELPLHAFGTPPPGLLMLTQGEP